MLTVTLPNEGSEDTDVTIVGTGAAVPVPDTATSFDAAPVLVW